LKLPVQSKGTKTQQMRIWS